MGPAKGEGRQRLSKAAVARGTCGDQELPLLLLTMVTTGGRLTQGFLCTQHQGEQSKTFSETQRGENICTSSHTSEQAGGGT